MTAERLSKDLTGTLDVFKISTSDQFGHCFPEGNSGRRKETPTDMSEYIAVTRGKPNVGPPEIKFAL